MRAAPVGMFAPVVGDDDAVFDLASETAWLTYGHPSGFLAAGYLGVAIAALFRGDPLGIALDTADRQLQRREHHEEVARAVLTARALAAKGRPSPEDLETLGGGWVAEEALAIAICCALAASDFGGGIRLAANHSGDTDSTAAIAGNLLGALLGEKAIPPAWLDPLELRSEIARIADDMHAAVTGALKAEDARGRYPGW